MVTRLVMFKTEKRKVVERSHRGNFFFVCKIPFFHDASIKAVRCDQGGANSAFAYYKSYHRAKNFVRAVGADGPKRVQPDTANNAAGAIVYDCAGIDGHHGSIGWVDGGAVVPWRSVGYSGRNVGTMPNSKR